MTADGVDRSSAIGVSGVGSNTVPEPGSRVSLSVVGVASIGIVAVSLVALVQILATPDRTLGDLALIELDVRRTFSSRPPLLGAYSRFGWRHPGPIFLYLLAVPYFVFGLGARALSVGALVLNVVWLVWSTRVVSRRGPVATASLLGCLLLMVSSMGANGIGNPWNVSLTMVPLAAVVISCWGVLCGDRSAGALFVVAYVFVFQTHVGAGVVVTPLALGTLIVVASRPALRRAHHVTKPGLVVLADVAVACSPVLIDIARRPPGNLGRLVRWSASNDSDTIGSSEALRLLARTSSLSFPFRSAQPRFLLWVETDTLGVLPGSSVVLLCALGLLAVRRRQHEEAALTAVLLALWCSGFVAARTVFDPPEWWLLQWLQPLGWMTVAAVVVLAWRVVLRPLFHPASHTQLGVSALLGVVIAFGVGAQIRHSVVPDGRSVAAVQPVDRLADAIDDVSDAGRVRIDIDTPDFTAESMLAGLVNESDRRHVEVCVSDEFGYKFPTHLVCSGAVPTVVFLRTEAFEQPAPLGFMPLAHSDPLTAQQRVNVDAVRQRVIDALVADGRDDLVPTVDTPLVTEAILADPGPAVAAIRDDVQWLDSIRSLPGLRYGLYEAV